MSCEPVDSENDRKDVRRRTSRDRPFAASTVDKGHLEILPLDKSDSSHLEAALARTQTMTMILVNSDLDLGR